MTSSVPELGLLMFVSAMVAIVTRRFGMPYTVGLVLAGIGLSLVRGPVNLPLSKDLIFSVFLPPLVFEAALYISWQELKQDLAVIALLASAGVLLAAAITTIGMHYIVGWDWLEAGAFGVLISATDPVSVIATFKEARVGGRLRLLVEAESLVNDGTAAVAFAVVLGMLGGMGTGVWQIGREFLFGFGGGVLCGAVVGAVLRLLASRADDFVVEITFTALAAYGSFQLAEHLHLSGVLATLTAGLVTGSYRSAGAQWGARGEAVDSFWEYVAFVVNSLIFLLIGARVAQQPFSGAWMPVLVAIGLVISGRALSIYPLCAMFTGSALQVTRAHQHVLFWGGLRGALALALALGLPAQLAHHDQIVTVAFAVVAFSICVQGVTMRPLLRHLGELSPQ
jgi:CPA1 family monovalent cation:H+ antiporter